MPEDCRCRGHCQNQRYATSFLATALHPHSVARFQRKQYAPIDIVLTEKKGFGLRATENLTRFAPLSVSTVSSAHMRFSPPAQG